MLDKTKRTILVAGMGTSPAVLTNAVWALAHQKTPVVPDEIVVIMTKNGKAELKKTLLSDGIWDEMITEMRRDGINVEGRLVFGETSIRTIPDAKGNELDDLRTGEDNLRAADFMLAQLRQYTEDIGTELHVSIAGGRKTMSALLFSCMTLLGRECDKVYHVLLPREFEGGTEPIFYFPKKGVRYRSRIFRKSYPGKGGELFEVPFVRMRGWYQDKFKTIPPSYRTLISRVQEVAPPAIAYPEIEIDAWNGVVALNGSMVQMSKPCFAMLVLLADGCTAREVHKRLLTLHSYKSPKVAMCDWLATFQESALFKSEDSVEDVFKTLSNLRKKLKEAGFENVETLVPQRNNPVVFPVNTIKWRNRDRVVDVCGCLFREIAP